MNDHPEWILAVLFGVVVSCFIAEAASGWRGTWPWGLLGPAGWVVAGLRGVQLRLDASQSADEEPAPQGRPSPPERIVSAPTATTPSGSVPDAASAPSTIRSVRGPPDGEGRMLVACACGTMTRLSVAPASVATCVNCGGKLPGFVAG